MVKSNSRWTMNISCHPRIVYYWFPRQDHPVRGFGPEIEGRGRSPNMWKPWSHVYREAVDAVNDGTYNQDKVEGWISRLKTVYNRGFWMAITSEKRWENGPNRMVPLQPPVRSMSERSQITLKAESRRDQNGIWTSFQGRQDLYTGPYHGSGWIHCSRDPCRTWRSEKDC